MSISPFAQQSITAEFISEYRKQLKEQAAENQREEFTKLYDFYLGGLQTADEKYIKQHYREEEQGWLQRKKRLRGVNICKPIIRSITNSMYGGEVLRHLRRPGAKEGGAVPRDDRILQQIIQQSDYNIAMKNVASNAAIFGTDIRGPRYDPIEKRIKFRTRYIDTVYPIQHVWEAQELSALMFEYEAVDPVTDESWVYVEFYTPWEIAYFRGESFTAPFFELIPAGELELDTNPWPNKYGIIPWTKFTAEPDPNEGIWFGVSDLRDAAEINNFVNELLSITDKNAHDQGWSQLVLINFPDDVTAVDIGTTKAIRVGEGGDVKYVIPDLKINEILQLIDKLTTFALEGANVPKAALRTYSEPKSGVSLELELKPLIDLATDRRRRWRESEAELLKQSMLMREVHEEDKKFTPEQAAAWMLKWDVSVEWQDDLMPHDLDKEIARDMLLLEAGLKDPLDLVEKYNELGGKTPEAKLKEIVKNLELLPEKEEDESESQPKKEA